MILDRGDAQLLMFPQLSDKGLTLSTTDTRDFQGPISVETAGSSVSWYSTSTKYVQMNADGYTYPYVGIG